MGQIVIQSQSLQKYWQNRQIHVLQKMNFSICWDRTNQKSILQ